MTRLLGASLVIGAASLGGFILGEKFTERCRMLKLWLRLLNILQTEIFYANKMLPEVFTDAAALVDDREFSRELTWLAQQLHYGSGTDLFVVWGQLLEKSGNGSLVKKDLSILRDLGCYLGGTDRNDQLEKIQACRRRLEINLENAEAERTKKVRLYRYTGFAAGASLVLWFF